MNSTAEYLAKALKALPESEKVEVINELFADSDFKEITAQYIVNKLGVQNIDQKEDKHSSHISSKERGKQLRDNYILKLQKNGVLIEQFDRLWSETSKGFWVAIPTSTMESRKGRWFLGLPENKVFDRISNGRIIVILLCQTESGSVLDFVIPQDRLGGIINKLSKSKGQLKFNLKQINSRYQLTIPNNAPFDLTPFLGNIELLRS